jgi:hypothetical protein
MLSKRTSGRLYGPGLLQVCQAGREVAVNAHRSEAIAGSQLPGHGFHAAVFVLDRGNYPSFFQIRQASGVYPHDVAGSAAGPLTHRVPILVILDFGESGLKVHARYFQP